MSLLPTFFNLCGANGSDHNAVGGEVDTDRLLESSMVFPFSSYLIKSDQLITYIEAGH